MKEYFKNNSTACLLILLSKKLREIIALISDENTNFFPLNHNKAAFHQVYP